MTTTVKVHAGSNENIEVRIVKTTPQPPDNDGNPMSLAEVTVIQAGERWEGCVYDDVIIEVIEAPKGSSRVDLGEVVEVAEVAE